MKFSLKKIKKSIKKTSSSISKTKRPAQKIVLDNRYKIQTNLFKNAKLETFKKQSLAKASRVDLGRSLGELDLRNRLGKTTLKNPVKDIFNIDKIGAGQLIPGGLVQGGGLMGIGGIGKSITDWGGDFEQGITDWGQDVMDKMGLPDIDWNKVLIVGGIIAAVLVGIGILVWQMEKETGIIRGVAKATPYGQVAAGMGVI